MKTSRVVLLVGLATAFSLLGDQTLYSVLPTYYTELGLLPYQVGLILSFNRGIRLLTNHLAERVCRRFNLGLLFGLALAGGALLTAVYALVPAFWILLLARMLWGLCWSFIRQISLVTVADSAGEGKVGRWMGFYSGISRLGSISGNFVGALGHDLFGYTTILLLFAALLLGMKETYSPRAGFDRAGMDQLFDNRVPISTAQVGDMESRDSLLYHSVKMIDSLKRNYRRPNDTSDYVIHVYYDHQTDTIQLIGYSSERRQVIRPR